MVPCKTPLPARPREVLGGHTGTPLHDLNQRVAESAPPTAFQLLLVLAGALRLALSRYRFPPPHSGTGVSLVAQRTPQRFLSSVPCRRAETRVLALGPSKAQIRGGLAGLGRGVPGWRPPIPRRTCPQGGAGRGALARRLPARTLEGAVALSLSPRLARRGAPATPAPPPPRGRPRPGEGRDRLHFPLAGLGGGGSGAGAGLRALGWGAGRGRGRRPLCAAPPRASGSRPGVEAAMATLSPFPTHPACSALPSAPRHL